MLSTLADFCFRSRRLVVALWLAAIAALVGLSTVAAGSTSDDYTLPDSASTIGMQLLAEHGLYGDDSAASLTVVFRDANGLATDRARSGVGVVLAQIVAEVPGVTVTGPFDAAARGQISADGTIGYATIHLPDDDPDVSDRAAHLPEVITAPTGMQVAFAGDLLQPADGGGPSMGIGLLAAAVILFLAFGSVWAMGLPILVGAFGAGCGVAAVMLTANLIAMSSAAVPLAAMLAVGVGIDYCLFIVTRYREALAEGLDPQSAARTAHATAGRAVALAGSTVVAAVLGLLTMGMPLINGVAVGAAMAIAITMAAALTLLPALLGFIGDRIDRFGLRHRRRNPAGRGALAERWARNVQQHPWRYTLAALVVLGLLTAPAAAMRLGFPDAGTDPATSTTRAAHDLLAEGFGPGSTGPLFLVVDHTDTVTPTQPIAELANTLTTTAGIASVSPPIDSPDRAITMLVITPETGPADPATADLVAHLDGTVIPALPQALAGHTYLTGTTAAITEFSTYTADRIPLFLTVIMALALILLAVMFRAPVVALKAVIVNLLSIGASFGVLVAALQWGWASALFGLDEPIPIVAWVPMMMVAVVFGLSMDYEVFLVSRIKEHHDAGMANADAVASGLAGTARVITAAAAIMICVFASFILGAALDLAVFGFGLAVAVLIDATLVRLVLVPAAMELLAERNWWPHHAKP